MEGPPPSLQPQWLKPAGAGKPPPARRAAQHHAVAASALVAAQQQATAAPVAVAAPATPPEAPSLVSPRKRARKSPAKRAACDDLEATCCSHHMEVRIPGDLVEAGAPALDTGERQPAL
jgi:hypothetical protein